MTILRRALAQLSEQRGAPGYLPWGDSTPPPPSAGAAATAGTTVNEQTALQVAAVYGSVNVIADAVSSLPIDLMSSPHRRSGSMLAPTPLITQPFEEISRQDWWTQFAVSLALRGNFFGHKLDRDPRTLFPRQIKPIHPDNARVRRNPDGTIEYRFHGQVIPTDDVFHVRYMSVAESLVGLNPVEYLRNILGVARAGDLYAASFYQNSANPSGQILVPDDLDAEEAKALKNEWMQSHGGLGAAQLPAVLTGGMKFEAISITPEQAQFLQSRQYSASTISGQIFRVPPHMIGIVDRTTSWGTGIEQQEMGFVRNTLIGYLSRGEEAITAEHPAGQFMKFDLSERLRGDRLQRAQAASLEIASGYLLPDEARADEDRSPLPGGIGQTAMAPINAQSLKQMSQASIQQVQQQQQQSPSQQSANDGNDSAK
jgi:HK97 family phage portal protein